MARYATEFAKYLLGFRAAYTSLTEQETGLLCELASKASTIVEVGVHEGATSRAVARALKPNGTLYLVDPYFLGTRLEKLTGTSWAMYIARRSVRGMEERVRFLRATSEKAAASIDLKSPADLIFIDADHSYDAVSADFRLWSRHLADHGLMAFHDSRLSPKRPDLGEQTGPVRFVRELLEPAEATWRLVHAVDSLSVIQRA